MTLANGQQNPNAPRIEAFRITPVAFRDPPLLCASGMHEPWTARTIIEVICENGVIGLSETYGDRATIEELEAVAPRLIGRAVTDLAGIEADIAAHINEKAVVGHQPSVVSPRTEPALRLPRIFSAFEVGCLDALARSLSVPLYDVLGGAHRKRVAFSAYLFFKTATHPGLDNPDPWNEIISPEQIVELAEMMVADHGFKSLKLKGGALDPEQEIECLQALALTFPNLPLRFDPNGNWTTETTLRMLPRMEGILEYLEDPVLGHAAMAEIQAQTSLPVATNMCVTGFRDIADALRTSSAQIILADHHFWGGLRKTLALDQLCASLGLGLSMHSNSHLGVSLMTMSHVAAACPNLLHDCDTHYCWVQEDLVQGGLIEFDGGDIVLTDAPGNGVELDRAAMTRMAADYDIHGTPHRDDTIYIRQLWPDWDAARPRF